MYPIGPTRDNDYLEISPVFVSRNVTNTMIIGIMNKTSEASNRFVFTSKNPH
jgi:hypothetical protein